MSERKIKIKNWLEWHYAELRAEEARKNEEETRKNEEEAHAKSERRQRIIGDILENL
jgi:hypothetical protein